MVCAQWCNMAPLPLAIYSTLFNHWVNNDAQPLYSPRSACTSAQLDTAYVTTYLYIQVAMLYYICNGKQYSMYE